MQIDVPVTRDRLLEAAGEVFAECGFRRATVRDICRRAEANVAAVNYHFGDKEQLYFAVLRHSFSSALRKYPPDGGLPPDAAAEQRLHAFIRSFLQRLLDAGQPTWHAKLMAREMVEPTSGIDFLLKETIRPMSQRLEQIVRSILGPRVGPELLRDCCASVVAQCVFYRHCEATICRLYPELEYTPEQIDRLADHVTRFSLQAMRGLAKGGRP